VASKILPNAQRFAVRFASKTGLNIMVVYAWMLLETSIWVVSGNAKFYNYLNVSGSGDAGTHIAPNGRHWAKYSSPEAGADAAYHLLLTGPSWTGYAAILAAHGKPAKDQYMAIVNSAWCAPRGKCYGGGATFADVLSKLPSVLAGQDIPYAGSSTLEEAASDPVGSFAQGAGIIGGSLLHFAAGAGKRIVFVLGGLSAAAFGLYYIAKETGVGAGIADKAKTAAKGVAIL